MVNALTNGRVSVSANPYTPRVGFYADVDQDGKPDMMMGDNIKSTGNAVKFSVVLSGKTYADTTYTVNVIKNGGSFNTYKLEPKNPKVEFTDTPALTGRTYYRVIVEGKPADYTQVPMSMKLTGNMVALSNPIYFNFDPNF